MPTLTSPAKTIQAAAAAVASDFTRVMAQGQEVMANTLYRAVSDAQEAAAVALSRAMTEAQEAVASALPRAIREAEEAITRDLARINADFHARFEELARDVRAAEAPGTMLGDYLTLVGERATEEQKAAALARFATVLGGGSLLLPPEKGGLRLRARRALRLIERDEGVPQSEILRQEIPVAVYGALEAFDQDRTRRDGQKWRTDEHRKVLHFTPVDTYRIPDLRGQARDHLRDLMRGCLEAELIERARLTGADDLLISQTWDEVEERGHWRDDSMAAWDVDDAVNAMEHDERFTPLRRTTSAEDVLLGAALVERSRLTPRERQVFSLLKLEPREIAKKLGIAEATVSVLKGRALKKIFAGLKYS
jgi:DNA-binding CsgD family transcriptional regulator